MSGGIGGWLKGLLGRKAATEAGSLADAAPLADMQAGPTFCLGLVYGRGADETIADNGLAMAMEFLKEKGIKATFICAGKLAETAPVALSRIRDQGHEIACHGYYQEQPQKLDDQMLSRVILKAREVMAKRGIHPAGYVPPSGLTDPRIWREVAKQGFKYISELKTDGKPCLAVTGPAPLVYLPMTSNDSGYVRHPDDPKHVYNKHVALLKRTIQQRAFLALSYHTWMFGERRERFEDFVAVITTALGANLHITPFVDALPQKYRPPPKPVERNEWGF